MDVDFQETCPQCGNQKIGVADTTSSYEKSHCSFCGHWRERDVETAKNTVVEGFGAYRITRKGQTMISIHSFAGLVGENDVQKLGAILSEPDIDLERSYATKWNPETKTVEYMFGSRNCVPMD